MVLDSEASNQMEKEVKQGLVVIHDGRNRVITARLKLTDGGMLSVQKEEIVCTSANNQENKILNQVRLVTITKEVDEGLGLSVKGGAEHKLPVLISRIVKGLAADRSGQLFVGDAILKVNSIGVETATHDEVVQALKNAGERLTLTVKHFKQASYFLNRGQNQQQNDASKRNTSGWLQLEKQWVNMTSIPLLYAFITRYMAGTDKLRPNAFEVVGVDGVSSGVVVCEDTRALAEWIQSISEGINTQFRQLISKWNKMLIPEDQICHVCWCFEKIQVNRQWQAWRPKFLALKGSEIYLFDTPPADLRDWNNCERVSKVFESMFRILKDTELTDERQHCFTIQTGTGGSIYLSLESRSDVLQLEKAWYRTNHHAVNVLKSKTFGCNWRSRLSGLTLDIHVGFSLYDSETRNYMWTYRFSQLKGSSDDGKSKLKLLFQNDSTKLIETREIECTSLQTLLFCIHAFLSAKLASVDPAFLQNF